MIHPRDFITEYVDPAIALWRENPTVKHLAVHAITQVDVLAEIVALWLAERPKLDQGEASKFRDELGIRESALIVIRNAHDSHKHGELGRVTATTVVSQGQRPETVSAYPFTLIPYNYLVYVLNDGTNIPISNMLKEAMKAWDRELTRIERLL